MPPKGVIGPNHFMLLIPSAYKLPLNNTVPVTKQNATRFAHVDETTPDSAGKIARLMRDTFDNARQFQTC